MCLVVEIGIECLWSVKSWLWGFFFSMVVFWNICFIIIFRGNGYVWVSV